MQHFFFNYRINGNFVRDTDGEELANFDEAIARAAGIAHRVVEDHSGGHPEDGRVEICNDAGLTVQVVSIKPDEGVD